jgi:hypothetical protein
MKPWACAWHVQDHYWTCARVVDASTRVLQSGKKQGKEAHSAFLLSGIMTALL